MGKGHPELSREELLGMIRGADTIEKIQAVAAVAGAYFEAHPDDVQVIGDVAELLARLAHTLGYGLTMEDFRSGA